MKYTNNCSADEFEYRDVVIVGNGPSGITLSYMLAGNWPYCSVNDIEKHPDELLRARLQCTDLNQSLVEQDLMELGDGLEGRSMNPVSLLLDSLQHPCADIGFELSSMLHYRYHPDKEIDHIVLGHGPPGGSWHRMDPNLRTLSLSSWMSLPGLDFNTWMNSYNSVNDKSTTVIGTQQCVHSERTQFKYQRKTNKNGQRKQTDTKRSTKKLIESKLRDDNTISTEVVQMPLPRRMLSVRRQESREVQTRALARMVAQYYESYVNEMNLQRFFHENTFVTSVKPYTSAANRKVRWLVKGFQSNGMPFVYQCRNVVLANGASDLANRLGVSGEDSNNWIAHDLPAMISALEQIPDARRPELNPVLIVGAGLSAADAVTMCRASGINVIHVYRNRSVGLDKMLPETVYPEYHEVHKMMKDCQNTYELYTPMPGYRIVEFISDPHNSAMPNNRVVLAKINSGEIVTMSVSYCAILIGFRPNLRFLEAATTNTNTTTTTTTNAANVNQTNGDAATEQLTIDATRRECRLVTTSNASNLLSRKIAWLKYLCAKCKNFNLCERSRRMHSAGNRDASCQCSDITCTTQINDTNNNAINDKSNDSIETNSTNSNNNCNSSHYNKNNIHNNNIHNNNDNHSDSRFCNMRSYKMLITSEPRCRLSLRIGEDQSQSIDCKTNPIAVDKFTNECLHVPNKGLYAMGPLVGDNFIRFIGGGALAITTALNKQNR